MNQERLDALVIAFGALESFAQDDVAGHDNAARIIDTIISECQKPVKR